MWKIVLRSIPNRPERDNNLIAGTGLDFPDRQRTWLPGKIHPTRPTCHNFEEKARPMLSFHPVSSILPFI
jgi:hypothetical protein